MGLGLTAYTFERWNRRIKPSVVNISLMSENDEQEVTRKTGLVYAAAFAIVGAVVVCLFIGWVLDRWFGTSPWFVVGGIVLGAVVGFYEFIRVISKIS